MPSVNSCTSVTPSLSSSGSVKFGIPSPSESRSTNRVKFALLVPDVFVAVTVNEVEAIVTVGLPDISPVTAFKLSPFGNAGVIV